MSDWLGQTNQKLYQARLLIDSSEASGTAAPLASACEEGAIFQLILAYQAYLHELAEIANCREAFFSLSQLLEKCTVPTGEMTELAQLEQDDYSWLCQLLKAFESCGHIKKSQAIVAGTIPVATQGSGHNVREWYQQLSDIIDLQRMNRQES
jgi:hypothetical protein